MNQKCIATAVLCICCAVNVQAAGTIPEERQLPRLVDDAGLLDSNQAQSLEKELDAVSERYSCDVAIITQNSLGGYSAQAYADDFYDYNGYGFGEDDSGILFLLGMEERKWAITTYGAGITAFTDAGQEYITEKVIPYLSDGDYNEAFSLFAELCGDFLHQAEEGKAYDVGSLPKAPFSPWWIPGSLGIGAILGGIGVLIMKGQLKTVRAKAAADDYVRAGGLHLTDRQDYFLYRHVDRRAKPKESSSGGGSSSTHTSSSGRSHGGSSGSF